MMLARTIKTLSWGVLLALLACRSEDAGPVPPPNPSFQASTEVPREKGPTSANPGAPLGGRNPFQPVVPAEPAESPPPVATIKPPAKPAPIGAGGIAQDNVRAGDSRLGRSFALNNCRPCHIVAPHQASPIRFADAPDFRAIANDPDTTPLGLNLWLTNPHPTMPTLVLSSDEAANVIAYILSLRSKRR